MGCSLVSVLSNLCEEENGAVKVHLFNTLYIILIFYRLK